MTEELKRAIKKAETLPEEHQKQIARIILDEIEWENSFQTSQDKLSVIAKEALSEYKAGKTKPTDW
jgi:hypothetical protein